MVEVHQQSLLLVAIQIIIALGFLGLQHEYLAFWHFSIKSM